MSNIATRIVLILTLFLMTLVSTSAVSETSAPDTERPRIGLVLGGGGAKGAAHIGVLEVLDELRVPIDCVVGTSMGALVGGTFAAGMPADQIKESSLAIDWSKTVGKEGLRDRMPINRKLEGNTYTNSLELGIKDGKLAVPGGLLKTQDIEDVIRDLVNNARFQRDFDDLSIPFRAVATDMVTGEMVVLGSGDLSIAMRASMAVPGAFSPVIIGDQVLSDGGMVRNLPVDIARELCADVVIAVWLSSPQPKAEDLNSALALVGRSMSVMINANETAQIATLTPDDVGIDVPMGDIGTGDFGRVPDAVELGKTAAELMAEELSRYAVSDGEYLAWRETVSTTDSGKVRLAEVQIGEMKYVNPEYVTSQLENVQAGAEVTIEQISEDTDRLYARGDFENVEYEITGPKDEKTIKIIPIEKSLGQNLLRFDFGFYAEGAGELLAILRAEHKRTWLNRYGGHWNNTLQIGRQTVLSTEIYQPLDVQQRYFMRPLIKYERNLENLYFDGDRVARYSLKELYGELSFGVNIGSKAQLSAGFRSGSLDTEKDIGSSVLPEGNSTIDSGFFITSTYDTRDDIGLPTRGSLIYFRYINSGSWLGGDQKYELAEGVITKSFPWRGDSLSLIAGAGAEIDGNLPIARYFTLGGIGSFPGLRLDELRGTKYWFAGTSYLWKLADIQPLMGQALYAGLRLQAGRMDNRWDGVDEGTLYGVSGSLNGRTAIGPFTLSLGYVTNDSWELQFTLGRPLPEGSALDEIN